MSYSSLQRACVSCLLAATPLAAQRGLFVEPFGARVLANPRVTLQDQTLRGIEGGLILGGLELAGQWAQATSADFRTARRASHFRRCSRRVRISPPAAVASPSTTASPPRAHGHAIGGSVKSEAACSYRSTAVYSSTWGCAIS